MQAPNVKKPSPTKATPATGTSKTRETAKTLIQWFHHCARDLPWRHTTDPYAVWVSEIMLQQTQVKTVIPYWERWMKELPTIESLASASPESIHKLWEGLGYYTRVRNLQLGAQAILHQHGGIFPRAYEAIFELPGIGRYTAGAIASIAFNQAQPILDGNVIRVLCRYFAICEPAASPATRDRLWTESHRLVLAAASLPAKPHASLTIAGNCSTLNQALMELGAIVCKPRDPDCARCPLGKTCAALESDSVNLLPNLEKRPRATTKNFAAIVIETNGKFLIKRRPSDGVNANYWEFPNVEAPSSPKSAVRLFKKSSGLALRNLKHLRTFRHSITRYRITLNVFRANLISQPGISDKPDWTWASPTELELLPFTAAHRKIIGYLTAVDCVEPPGPKQRRRRKA